MEFFKDNSKKCVRCWISSEPNIYDTQHPVLNRDCLKLFHLWIQALKQMKIFDHKGLTNLAGASQDPIARGYSYIVKTENYSAFKCCFQEVRIIKHRTHSPKEVVCLILLGSCSGKPFFNVPTHFEKKFSAAPRAPLSLLLSFLCPAKKGDASSAPVCLEQLWPCVVAPARAKYPPQWTCRAPDPLPYGYTGSVQHFRAGPDF